MQSSASGKTVLCVDDDDAIRHLLEAALGARGYNVLTASTGEDAVEIASGKWLEAIILDYYMGSMTGEHIAEQMKRINPSTPIILFSGSFYTLPPVLAHVDGFVHKGAGLDELIGTLERLLKRPRLVDVRRFPRHPVQLQFAVLADRAGNAVTLQGVSINVGEGGIAGNVDGNLAPGELVSIIMADPRLERPLAPRAQVRHNTGNTYGFEFVELGPGLQGDVQRFCHQLASA